MSQLFLRNPPPPSSQAASSLPPPFPPSKAFSSSNQCKIAVYLVPHQVVGGGSLRFGYPLCAVCGSSRASIRNRYIGFDLGFDSWQREVQPPSVFPCRALQIELLFTCTWCKYVEKVSGRQAVRCGATCLGPQEIGLSFSTTTPTRAWPTTTPTPLHQSTNT